MSAPLICLGLEGSANKLGIGIVRSDGEILANVRKTYNPPTGEGFIPANVSLHHQEHILPLIREAFATAKVRPSDIGLIAYTRGPGIGGPLSKVAIVARMLAQLLDVPLAPVNHCVAHIEMGRLVTGVRDPVVLYASGGNTQIISHGRGCYRIFGETLDIAVGNCLDRVARVLGLPNAPSPGHNVMLGAARARARVPPPPLLALPYAVKGMDVSCGGLQTFVQEHVRRARAAGAAVDADAICYAVEETLFAMLVEVTERAAAHCGARDILVVGGVGCNARLQEMLATMAAERGGALLGMDERFAIDNGAMIAYTGLLLHASSGGAASIPPSEAARADTTQRFRTDEVETLWRN